MDIDDILAEVSRPTRTSLNEEDLQELTRAWVNERVAPEILPYPSTLMDRTMDRIRRQIEIIEEKTGSMEPRTNFQLIVLSTELERFKFLVRSFLRARIAKIDEHTLHILSTPSVFALLSTSEQQYAQAHQTLISSHYSNAFLSHLPQQLQRLDDTAGGLNMIDTPDLDKAVFCRVLRDVGEVAVEGTDAVFQMNRGDVWVVRWRTVRRWVLSGDVELI